MRKLQWRLLTFGLALSLTALPARSGGNLGLQLESRMVLMTGCAIWSGSAPDQSEQDGVRIVCSPDASSLAVNVNSPGTVRQPEGLGGTSPVKFVPSRFPFKPTARYSDTAFAHPLVSTDFFGIQLSGVGLFIPVPASGWRMTGTSDAGWQPELDLLRITLSW
jgi:hypothetical protein